MIDKYGKSLGLDMSLEDALERFVKATNEENSAKGLPSTEIIPEGSAQLVIFKEYEIRKVFHSGEWYFSIVDVISAVTDSTNPRRYWSDLRRQISAEGGFFNLAEDVIQITFSGQDNSIDAVNTETLFRIMQSIRSPKAEPFKRWLARVGYERIQEIQNPEIAIKRAILTYQMQGRSDDWIEKRIRSIVTRKELTGEWRKRGIQEGREYATLSNLISIYTFGGIDISGHKRIKKLKSQNLRDHMTDLELIFTMLGEKSTTEIARTRDAQGYTENANAAKAGGSVAGVARQQLEKETGQAVVSSDNFLGHRKRRADPEHLTKHLKLPLASHR